MSTVLLKKAMYVSGRDRQSVLSLSSHGHEVNFISDPVLCDTLYHTTLFSQGVSTNGAKRLWILKYADTAPMRQLFHEIKKRGDVVCFFEPHLDFPIVEFIPNAIPIYCVEDILYLIDNSSDVVSMRFHGCILALLRDKPIYGLQEAKSLSLLTYFGIKSNFSEPLLTPEEISFHPADTREKIEQERQRFLTGLKDVLTVVPEREDCSSEYRLYTDTLIAASYRAILGRRPDPAGLDAYRAACKGVPLSNGVERVLRSLLSSAEGKQTAWNRHREEIVQHALTSLYRDGVLSIGEMARACVKVGDNNSTAKKFTSVVDLGIGQTDILDAFAAELLKHERWGGIAKNLRLIVRALVAFEQTRYDVFHEIIAKLDWFEISQALRAGPIKSSLLLEYLEPLRFAARHLSKEKRGQITQLETELESFFERVGISSFIPPITELTNVTQKQIVFASCDISYYKAFADILATSFRQTQDQFLYILLYCGEENQKLGQELAKNFNKYYHGQALTLLQVSLSESMARSFYTIPRLLALAFAVCALGREATCIDIDVLPGPSFGDAKHVGSEYCDVMLPISPTGRPWDKIFAGYVRVKPTPQGREFAESFCRFLIHASEPQLSQWHLDQNSLLVAYLKAAKQQRIRLYDIWEEFQDRLYLPRAGGITARALELRNKLHSYTATNAPSLSVS